MAKFYLHGGIVLPLNGTDDWFDPGVVTFNQGEITYVGPAETAPPPDADATKIDCSERLILPGLVNTHTHTGMSFFRNLLEDLSSLDWFQYEQEAERFLSQEDIYWAALLGAYELLRQGEQNGVRGDIRQPHRAGIVSGLPEEHMRGMPQEGQDEHRGT